MDSIPYKRCKICGVEFPATTEFFYKKKGGKYGVNSRCIPCDNELTQQYSKKWNAEHPEQVKQHARNSYERNKELVNTRAKEWRKQNKVKFIKSVRDWQKRNPDTIKAYRENNRDRIRVQLTRRRARQRSLPDTLTVDQWQAALEYFNGCCAVCGRPLYDLFGTHHAAQDHWIPISNPDCPGTVATNIVPLCHGQEGCNNSKSDSVASEWLEWKFGKKKAKEILARIGAYFELVRKAG